VRWESPWAPYFFAVVALVVSSLVVLELESRAPGGNIATGRDALWWAFVTVATVGYGDLYPVTGGGRAAAVLLMLVGACLLGVLTSLLASKFVAATRSEQEEELTALRDEVSLARNDMAHVKAELAAMKDLLRERDGPSREPSGRDGEPHEGE
jgi:voltage-gated potassium channel